jgi:hypothetical protein
MKEPTLIKGAVYHVTPRGVWAMEITSGYVEYQGLDIVGPTRQSGYTQFHFKTLDGYDLYVKTHDLDKFFGEE